MKSDLSSLWQSLVKTKLVSGACPELSHADSPWYVKMLLAVSGWLAALFLILFMGLALENVFDNNMILTTLGLVMILAAFGLLRLARNEFVEHIALALSLAGQALMAWAIFAEITDDRTALALIALVEISLALIIPSYLHRIFSSFVAAIAFCYSLSNGGLPYLAEAILLALASLLWLNEFRFLRFVSLIRAVAYGLTLALIPLKGSALLSHGSMTWRHEVSDPVAWLQPWMGETLLTVVLICVVWQLLKRQGLGWPDRRIMLALLAALATGIAALKAPGISIGLVILLLGFSASNSVLTGLGIVSLLFFSSSYYYLADLTLLTKAQILMATGIVLLGVRWLAKYLLNVSNDRIDQLSQGH